MLQRLYGFVLEKEAEEIITPPPMLVGAFLVSQPTPATHHTWPQSWPRLPLKVPYSA